MQLGKLLREYDIRPKTIRFANGVQAKGYAREMFTDAWSRYCSETPADPEPTIEAATLWPPTWPERARAELHGSLGRLEPSHGTARDNGAPP